MRIKIIIISLGILLLSSCVSLEQLETEFVANEGKAYVELLLQCRTEPDVKDIYDVKLLCSECSKSYIAYRDTVDGVAIQNTRYIFNDVQCRLDSLNNSDYCLLFGDYVPAQSFDGTQSLQICLQVDVTHPGEKKLFYTYYETLRRKFSLLNDVDSWVKGCSYKYVLNINPTLHEVTFVPVLQDYNQVCL